MVKEPTQYVVTEQHATRQKQLIWLFTISFILHNLEELIRMPIFLDQHMHTYPAFFQKFAGNWQPQSFSLSIWILNFLAVVLAFVLTINVEKRWAHLTITFLAGIMIINALMHIAQSLFLGSIVPGLVTAVFLILPISSRLLIHELKTDGISKKELGILIGVGLLSMPLLIWLVLRLSTWLIGWIG
ncbi:MAG: HXXEE domain-containing protein [Anaerolineaceae bacterium]|nr:HXXEE domain-containing protein [Anaerolineaceae bacterium]